MPSASAWTASPSSTRRRASGTCGSRTSADGMTRVLAGRVASLGFVLWLVTIIAFVLIRLAPGDPSAVMLGSDATPAAVAEFRARYGLDRPIAVQYLAWLGHVVRGDLGNSIYLGRPVTTAILERLPVSLTLTLTAFVIAIVLGITLGLVAAYWHDTWADRAVSAVAALGLSLPSFWLGICLIYLLAARGLAAPAPARLRPGLSTIGAHRPHDSRVDARRAPWRFRENGALEGCGRALRGRQARLPQRRHPRAHRVGYRARRSLRRRGGDRDGLHPARGGSASRQRGGAARLSRGPGHAASGRRVVRGGQHRGRPPLHAQRPPRATADVVSCGSADGAAMARPRAGRGPRAGRPRPSRGLHRGRTVGLPSFAHAGVGELTAPAAVVGTSARDRSARARGARSRDGGGPAVAAGGDSDHGVHGGGGQRARPPRRGRALARQSPHADQRRLPRSARGHPRHRPHGRARAERGQRGARPRRGLHAPRGARGARQGAADPGDALRGGGARAGRTAEPGRSPAYPAQCHAGAHRAGDLHLRLRHPRRGDAVLPRGGSAPARAVMGQHARGGALPRAGCVLDQLLPRPAHRAGRPRRQYPGRWSKRSVRSSER